MAGKHSSRGKRRIVVWGQGALAFALAFAPAYLVATLATGSAVGGLPKSDYRSRSEPVRDFRPVVIRRFESKPLHVADPANTILVVYNHGSTSEFRPDSCPTRTPSVVAALDGERIGGKRVQVYIYCTPSKTGEYVGARRDGEPKVTKRARDIEGLLDKAARMGVPPSQIFLFGQSAGGWASLLVARRARARFNALVAFAPAFAGRWAVRSPGWWHIHNRQAAYIREAPRIPGLVYAFEGDPWNTPDHLAFLRGIRGIEFVALRADAIDGVECVRRVAHFLAYRACFRQTQLARISAFLRKRLHGAE